MTSTTPSDAELFGTIVEHQLDVTRATAVVSGHGATGGFLWRVTNEGWTFRHNGTILTDLLHLFIQHAGYPHMPTSLADAAYLSFIIKHKLQVVRVQTRDGARWRVFYGGHDSADGEDLRELLNQVAGIMTARHMNPSGG